MSDQIRLKKKTDGLEIPSVEVVEAVGVSEPPQEQKKGWLKGWLPMAICCGAPLLLLAAISLFGASLAGVASGLLSLIAVLACPLGMYFMMRMMTKQK